MRSENIQHGIFVYAALFCIAAFTTVSAQQAETSAFQPSSVTVSSYYDVDNGKYYRVHLVEKGHTLYSIARAYKCAVSDIIKKSPQGDNTISVGEPLRIPLFNRQDASSLTRYNVKDTLAKHALAAQTLAQDTPVKDTLAEDTEQELQSERQRKSRSKSKLKSELKSESEQESEQELLQDEQPQSPQQHTVQLKPEKDIINISVMLPLYADDTLSPKKQFYFLPLLQGILLAMEETGKYITPKININVFDLTEKERSWDAVKNDPKFLESDIILCAAFRNIFPHLDAFSQKKHIPLVHLHSERDSICFDNPYFMQLLPSQSTQIEILADSLIAKFNHSNFIIFVEDVAVGEKFHAAQYLHSLLENAKNEKTFNPRNIHFYDPNEAGVAMFTDILDNKNSNVVCGFTRQEIRLANMFVPLLKNDPKKEKGMLINDYKISLFGPAAWAYFTKIDPELFYRTSFTYFNTFATRTDSRESKNFEKRFYNNYNALPDGMAYKGYIFSKWLFEALQQYNVNFISNLKECNENSVMGVKFNFVPTNNGSENRSVEFVKFFD
jgi:LysM repeat protein